MGNKLQVDQQDQAEDHVGENELNQLHEPSGELLTPGMARVEINLF